MTVRVSQLINGLEGPVRQGSLAFVHTHTDTHTHTHQLALVVIRAAVRCSLSPYFIITDIDTPAAS